MASPSSVPSTLLQLPLLFLLSASLKECPWSSPWLWLFSVDSLKKENLLIKNLDALETSGQIIDILTGKTATLTTGDMDVARINIANYTHDAD